MKASTSSVLIELGTLTLSKGNYRTRIAVEGDWARFTAKECTRRDTYHKASFTNRKYSKRSTGNFVCTPFHTSCPARYSVLHLMVYCWAV
ncbi:MAG: hypothetical protein IJW71_01580, partial [Clostridia bacterium]|nr:hypothetical protein [Clostridia bacterium]